MKESLAELLSFLQDNHHKMVSQLHEFCEINSNSENLQGLTTMRDTLQTAFTPIADQIESIKLDPISFISMTGETSSQSCGDVLFIRKRPHLERRVLLSGHMDTVYSVNHPFQKLKHINDNCINGPGVADMKGGLIVMLHALTTFETSPLANQLGWDVVINADEEIGSPASQKLFTKLASNYEIGLVYEPAMTITGTLAKNRKGSGKLTLIATGKPAHVGRAFHEGRNAICYLAEAISAIDALNGKYKGVTINIGKIAGGDALNVVPDKAIAKLDIRITLPEDEHLIRHEIEQIRKNMQREGYSLTIQGEFGRPVKRVQPTLEHLFSRVQHIGQELGIALDWQDSGGCCDGNNLAQHGLPVLDTMGVRGGNIHTPEEFILLDSLVERASLSAFLLMDIAREGPPSS